VKGCEGWKLRSSRTQQVKSNWNPELENLLDQCTHLLKLPSRAKHLYTTQGRKVEDLSQVSEGQVWLHSSHGGVGHCRSNKYGCTLHMVVLDTAVQTTSYMQCYRPYFKKQD
jgi:hypothetical protein